jgi:phosphoribosylaminoimidazolecarboxamide formyltransferase/IMP cyclohydrolase
MPAMPDPRDPVDSAPMSDRVVIRRALVSVYDKTGLEPLVRALHGAGVEIVSTGSTAATIEGLGLPVTSVEQVTEFAEMLDGRVKTLHPRIHAGLLADQDDAGHMAALEASASLRSSSWCRTSTRSAQTVASGPRRGCVEQIDIGGPAMVRSSAKNHASVASWWIRPPTPTSSKRSGPAGSRLAQRQRLALAAFRHTADYDMAVAGWLGSAVAPDDVVDDTATGFPGWIAQSFERAGVLRYGENPHQRAALYVTPGTDLGIAHAEQLPARRCLQQLHRRGRRLAGGSRLRRALRSDHQARQPVRHRARFRHRGGAPQGARLRSGERLRGVVAANRPVSTAMADQLADVFTEVVVAPGFDDGVVEAPRPQEEPAAASGPADGLGHGPTSSVRGAARAECRPDRHAGDAPANWTLATGAPADPRRCATSASPGAPSARSSRTPSCWPRTRPASAWGWGRSTGSIAARLAVDRAGDRAAGAVAASDAFFPFPDGLEILLAAGVRAVVQPADLYVTSWRRTRRRPSARRCTSPAPGISPIDVAEVVDESFEGADLRGRTFEDTDFVRCRFDEAALEDAAAPP